MLDDDILEVSKVAKVIEENSGKVERLGEFTQMYIQENGISQLRGLFPRAAEVTGFGSVEHGGMRRACAVETTRVRLLKG